MSNTNKTAIFRMIRPVTQNILRLFNISLLIFLSVLYGYAQQGYPKPQVYGESNETVSLFTGRVNINLPLAKLTGRGDSSTSISTINKGKADFSILETSRQYDQNGNLYQINYMPNAFTYDAYFYANDYSPIVLAFQTTWAKVGQPVWTASGPMSTVLTLTGNDGNKVQFRDSLRDGEPTELDEGDCLVNFTIQWNPNDPPPPPATPPPAYCSRGKIFHSTDGSAMTFVSDYNVYDAHYTDQNDPWATVTRIPFIEGQNGYDSQGQMTSGFLYLPNGAKYRIMGGKPVWMVDRHGNQTTYSYEPMYSGTPISCNENDDKRNCRLRKVTDSLNRFIDIIYDYPE